MKKFITLTLTLLVTFLSLGAVEVAGYRNNTGGRENPLVLQVDRVDYRGDLTRVYARLVGRPHTSQRIDGVSLKAAGKLYTATDIDGVDFKRWFQWEEDGVIPIEIDFPAMKPTKAFVVTTKTPRGDGRTTVSK